MIKLTCPSCGANLSIDNETSREYAFCEYCGTRIALQDKPATTVRYIDEARIREAELNAQIRLKELELESNSAAQYEKRVANNRKFFRKRLLIYIIVGFVSLFLGGILSAVISEKLTIPLISIGSLSLCFAVYGSIGHGIAMLIKRNKK